LTCDAEVPPAHPLLASHTGRDLNDLRDDDPSELEPIAWLERQLCARLWETLAQAGAHAAPKDLRLPARASLRATLVDAYLDDSRIVDQRISNNLWPVSVPHWSLEIIWRIHFQVQYSTGVLGPSLDLVLRGEAHQEDYQELDLAVLLASASKSALSRLPRVLADEGSLGELLFTLTKTPQAAPRSWRVEGVLAQSFALLLSTSSDTRHGALAMYLGSSRLPLTERLGLARWFVINEPDLPIRRDALAWLLQQEPNVKSGESLSAPTIELLAWLLHRATSHRIRAAALTALAGRKGSEIRDLLLLGAGDADPRVADVALSQLRNFKAATAQELDTRTSPKPPTLPPWTKTLDGRVADAQAADTERLLALASAAQGKASDLWLRRWLKDSSVAADTLDWNLSAWIELSGSQSLPVRKAALQRLIREQQFVGVAEAIAQRAQHETEPELLGLALANLEDNPTSLQVLLAAASHPEAPIRRAAATALAGQGAAAAELRLRSLARDDRDRKVRSAARKALRKRARRGR